MSQARRKLPIGIQTFSEIIDEGHYYVDKTAFACRLIDEGKHYFLSRPRRFGKSLFLDTLKELFEGNEPLFRGLYAQDHWDWTRKYPVLRLSFGGRVLKSRAELDGFLQNWVRVTGNAIGLKGESAAAADCFADFIRQLSERTGRGVVVLIDEYDKPILDTIADSATAIEMREGLKDFYSVLKDNDQYLRFVFLTGVSKFSKVSLFSGLNNLTDITVESQFSAICGYTDADVDRVFAPELEGLDREEIRRWYNGYNWTGEAVYNPFDLLLLFRNKQFKPYWFETGTPSFLVKLLAQHGFFTPDLARLRTGLEVLSTFDVDRILPEALMFQAGYLTIHKAEEPIRGHWVYTLGYPNREVESCLNASLLATYTDDISRSFAHRLRLQELLLANEVAGLRDWVHAVFARIPHQWMDNNPITRYEGYYASVFYSYFAALGLDVRVEDPSNQGRVDMTVIFGGRIYLFEFKVVELAPEGRALQQIKDRGYADKYRASGLPIALIGIEFSRQARNVVGFEVESAS